MARGKRAPRRGRVGRAPARGMARGGRTRPAPRGRAMARGRRPAPSGRGRQMPGGGMACGGMNQPPCASPGGGGYRRGGRARIRPTSRRMQVGGSLNNNSGLPTTSGCPIGWAIAADGSCIPEGS